MAMSTAKLRGILACVLFCLQLVVMASVVVAYGLGGFKYEEMTTTEAILVPLLGVYTIAALKSVTAQNVSPSPASPPPAVSGWRVFFSFLLPLVFHGALVLVIYLKTYNLLFGDFERFKWILGLIGAVLGGYSGFFITSLYEKSP